MLQNDASQAGSTPDARNDLDVLAQCDLGPATGNTITGVGTVSGAAGADTANGPAMVVAVNGVESSGGTIQVEGTYGSLVMQSDGSYTYTRKPGAPDGVSDVFTYTLADSAGARDDATLTIDIRCEEDEPQDQQSMVTTQDGVVMLPAGVELSDIRVVGRDLVITLPDGSTMTIPNGAVFVPQIVIGDVAVPPTNLAALLIESEPQPAAGTPQSSGGNFAVDVPPLDPGVPLGDLIPPTEMSFPQPVFEEVGDIVDRDPEILIQPEGQPASVAAVDSVEEAGLPERDGNLPDEPAGSGESADGNGADNDVGSETTTGTILIDSPDEPNVIAINGTVVTAVGQTIEGQFGTLTITSISDGAIGYSYTLDDNTSGNDTHDDFSVSVTDNDGDVDTATLRIDIVDDVPTARPDTDSIAAGQFGPATGNVITDASDGDAGDSDTNAADTVGADNASLTAVSGFGGSDSTFSEGVLTVNGQYGVLTIAADGSYSYVRNAGTPGGVTDTFNYTLTDGDGDTSTSTLTISIADATPSLAAPAAVQLDDDALAGGNPGTPEVGDDPDSVNASGNLAGSGGDGDLDFAFSATQSGLPAGFTANQVNASTLQILQGDTVVLTITLNNETGAYTVVQNNPIDHAAGNLENNTVFNVSLFAQDVDGDASNAVNLTINVDDDTPVIGREDVGAPTLEVDETNLAANATGNFAALFGVSYGADGAGTTVFAVSVVNGTDSGLTDVATGDPILLFNNNGVVEGRVGGAEGAVAFTVSVDASTGVVTLDQLRALEHPNAADPDDQVSPTATSIQLSVTATDADGDPVSETINIGGSLAFDDDGPSVSGVTAAAGVLLDETEAGSPDGFPISATSEGAAIVVGSSAFGADGAGTVTYGLSLQGGGASLASGLATAIGDHPITLVQVDADTIEGRYDGDNVAFTIDIDPATGALTVTQEVPLEHLVDGPPGPAHDDPLDLGSLVNATVTVTDRDGDSVSGSAAIGDNIVFEDDGPTIDVTAAADAGVLLQTQDAQTIGGASDSASSTADFSAVFDMTFDGGADGAAGTPGLNFTLGVSAQGVNSGLTQGGAPIFLYLTASGAVVGSTSATLAGVTAGNTVFAVSVDSGGIVTLTQHSQIDHGPEGVTTAPFDDQLASIADQLITLTATSAVADNDGDTASDSVTVNIGANLQFADDGPDISAVLTGTQIRIDETDGVVAAGGEVDPIGGNLGTVTVAAASLFTVSTVHASADSPTTLSYALTLSSQGVNSGLQLSTTNAPIFLYNVGGVVVGSTSATIEGVSTANTAFTVSIDPSTGAVTMTQFLAVEHGNTASHDEDSSGLAAGALSATVTATDFDGDTDSASVDLGSVIRFEDDGPSIDVTAEGEAGVLLTTQDAETIGAASDTATSTADFSGVFDLTSSGGSDGTASVTDIGYTLQVTNSASGLTSQGVAVNLYSVGGVIVGSTALSAPATLTDPSVVFTIAVNGDGIVTLTQLQQIDHDPEATTTAPFDDQFEALLGGRVTLTATATITDNDGDTATDSAVIDLGGNIRFADDGPDAVNDTDTVAGSGGTATGNVITDAHAGDALDTDTGADDVGADTPGRITFISSSEDSDTVPSGGSVTIDGEFGTLEIFSNGDYIYTRTDGLGGGETETFTYTLTDFDGDTDTATLTIEIDDLIPVATTASAAVDDDGLGGNPAGTNDINANTFPDPDDLDGPLSSEATFRGMLGFTPGDGDTDFSLIEPADGMTVGQETVNFTLVGNLLTATIATSPDATRVGDPLFTVSLDPESGEYTVTLVDNILHGDDANNDEDGTEVAVNIQYQVSDVGGDPSVLPGTLTIVFNDDVPTAAVSTAGFSISHDETPGLQGDANDVAGPLSVFSGVTNPGDDPDLAGTGPLGFATGTGAIGSTGTLFGADGGTATFSLAVSAQGADSGLDLTNGTSIFLFVENGLVVGRAGTDATDAADNPAAFALAIDSATGAVSMVQYLSIRHPTGGPSSPDESIAMINGAVLAVVTVTDADGDTSTASTGIGSLVSFQDDAPSAFTPDPAEADNGNSPPVIEPLNLNMGVDGLGSLAFDFDALDGEMARDSEGRLLNMNGEQLFYQVAGNVLTAETADGDLGFTITLNTNGTYTFDVNGVISNGTEQSFTNLTSSAAGNVLFRGVGADDATNNETNTDLLLSGHGPEQAAGTVNTDSDSIGVDSQAVNPGSGVRIDFVTNLTTDETAPVTTSGFEYTAHVETTHFEQFIPQVQGSQSNTVNIVVTAILADDDQVFDNTPYDADGNDSFEAGETQADITSVTINDYSDDATNPVLLASYTFVIGEPAPAGSAAAGFTVTFVNGSVVIEGLKQNDQYEIDTATPFSAVVVESPGGDNDWLEEFDPDPAEGSQIANAHDLDLGILSIGTASSGDPIVQTFPIIATDGDGDTVNSTITTTINPLPLVTSSSTPVQEAIVDKSALLVSESFDQELRTLNAANNNAVYLGAIAAAGIGATPAAAHDGFAAYAEMSIGGESGFTLDAMTMGDIAGGEMQIDSMLIGKSTAAVQDISVDSVDFGRSAPAEPIAALDVGDISAQSAPVELPGGTELPVQVSGAEIAPAAMTVAMPAAETLIGAKDPGLVVQDAPSADELAGILADALAGGGSGPNLDALLDAATGHDAVGSADALVVNWAAAVSHWDMGAFGGFSASHSALSMDAMTLHPDAAQLTAV